MRFEPGEIAVASHTRAPLGDRQCGMLCVGHERACRVSGTTEPGDILEMCRRGHGDPTARVRRQVLHGRECDGKRRGIITPPELHFRLLTPQPIVMAEGTLIRYRLRLLGVPFEWLTRISVWNPPQEFVDEQVEGPYQMWMHKHLFVETSEGTRMHDAVTYELPFYPVGELAAPLVHLQVRRIFTFRARALKRVLGC